MGFIERARLASLDISANTKVALELPKLVSFGSWSLGRCVRRNAERLALHPAILFEHQRLNWKAVNAAANQYAHFFKRAGIDAGDVVSLLMDNRPEYLFAQVGLNKIGAVSALINTHLTGESLAHAINTAQPRAVLTGSEHWGAVREIQNGLELEHASCDIWVVHSQGKAPPADARVIDDEVSRASSHEPTPSRKLRTDDPACYIYTSGTTGLPKAAVVKNQRFMLAGTAFGKVVHEAKPGDVIYVTLPLYHSSAQWIGWGACATTGATLALRTKFSASAFWTDLVKFRATHFLYIGECCRYLLNQPPHPDEKKHHLRLGVGNGLRPDIWEPFQKRFGIPLIREFYGATEGNAPMINMLGRPGMVGRLRSGQVLVRCDPATGNVVQNEKGFCEKVKVGDTGLLLGKIGKLTQFDGYVEKEATQKKILRHVLKPGDQFFNSGDLLTLHEDNWVSFADRVGDTFRWKGENVSTNQVAEILNAASGVLESNVYGVHVPGTDGRAGMASLNVDDAFSVNAFAAYVEDRLPGYQRPYFIRIQRDMRITGTFKHQKTDYRQEGFDPTKTEDPIFFLNGKRYVPVDEPLFKKLQTGEVTPK